MSTTMESARVRTAALDIADRLAAKLADPDQVARNTGLIGGSDTVRLSWSPSSLSRGHPGIALLFAHRVGRASENALTAHRHVMRSIERFEKRTAMIGLCEELCGLAFSLEMSRRALGGGYDKALGALHSAIADSVTVLCDLVTAQPRGVVSRYDVISGLAGIGGYLLLRAADFEDELARVLGCLVMMAEDLDSAEPCYWSPFSPRTEGVDADLRAQGHLNLGLAHGIAGPLALLSIAHGAGCHVPGQHAAAEQIVRVFQKKVRHGPHGPFWPGYLSRREWTSEGEVTANSAEQPRASWCYGVPGMARALQLAARHFRRQDWQAFSQEVITAFLASPMTSWKITDACLCHGWAGILQLAGLFAEDAADDRTAATARRVQDETAALIVDAFDDELPFGFRIPVVNHPAGANHPGFLEGATGIALALDSYARRENGGIPWHRALLLA